MKQEGIEIKTISSSGDRGAAFTIESDSLEDVKIKQKMARERIKIIAQDGTDIARHDLMEEYDKYWQF